MAKHRGAVHGPDVADVVNAFKNIQEVMQIVVERVNPTL